MGVFTVPLARALRDHTLLATGQARKLWPHVERGLRRLTPGGSLVLDFDEVDRVGVGFLDAMVQMLAAARMQHPGRFTLAKLDGADPDVIPSLDAVLDRSGGPLAVITHGSLRIMGHLTASQAQTLEIVQAGRHVTSTDVARRLRIPPNAASNRLYELYRLGLIGRRDEAVPRHGGHRFIYLPIPDVLASGDH